MPLDAGFMSMLSHNATWEAATGLDQWGNETYAAPVAIDCFLAKQNFRYGDTTSDTQESVQVFEGEIYTDALGIDLNDKITVSGHVGYVTAVETPKDENGTDLMHMLQVTETRRG